MLRAIFYMLCAVSLMLLLATIGGWWASRRAEIGFNALSIEPARSTYDERIGFVGDGRIWYINFVTTGLPITEAGGTRWKWHREAAGAHQPLLRVSRLPDGVDVLGFMDRRQDTATAKWRKVSCPLWFVMLVFALLPTIWLMRARRTRMRRSRGLCLSCGYDLRESAAQCPECGAARALPAAE